MKSLKLPMYSEDIFLNLIKFIPPKNEEGHSKEEDLEEAKKSFEDWCIGSLTKKADDILVSNIQTFCSPKEFSTIEELIKKNGEKLLTGSDLDKKYKEIQDLKTWKEDSVWGTKDLKIWCEENKSEKFSDKGVFTEIYPKFRFRCVKAL
ncbi:hypothetical protein MHC_04215 [Mycoplasma haemocanis str. Illinois]|uniref:Uncharacterized protein n=1 Tax=Mycoplasma haemocanis (strain Illinois) TaxID=1111676 RepID=H6N7S7_MYCHN|nr:hypothetical protein MHC_04215 [Mycoplasma haemocanis str. Illinois]